MILFPNCTADESPCYPLRYPSVCLATYGSRASRSRNQIVASRLLAILYVQGPILLPSSCTLAEAAAAATPIHIPNSYQQGQYSRWAVPTRSEEHTSELQSQ